MPNAAISTWRRRIGAICTFLGVLLFAAALFEHLRYAQFGEDLHVQERLQHAKALNLLWQITDLGSLILCAVSLFGLGWSRWTGLLANGSAFLCSLMILGAMCGPFGC
jgi:hypothetical protein